MAQQRIRESAEDYLETILILQNKKGSVRSVDIAGELGFSKPSVSVAMKNLRAQDCIIVDNEGLISLTDKGRAIAERIYERHVLFTDWLTSLGVDPQVASEEACRIEHVFSDESFHAIKEFLTGPKG